MAYYYVNERLYFPPVNRADIYGVIAIGGDLSAERLLLAYKSGIFPWYNEGDPIIWHTPNPRFILYPNKLIVSKSMRQILKKNIFEVTFDKDFEAVMQNCGLVERRGQSGTWITQEMLEAYCHLHKLGYAHSVEVWQHNELVGGLYGVSLGKVFFGESMFAKVSNASKVGFITLVGKLIEKGIELIDSQVYTNHLESLGAENIKRDEYVDLLQSLLQFPDLKENWGNWLINNP